MSQIAVNVIGKGGIDDADCVFRTQLLYLAAGSRLPQVRGITGKLTNGRLSASSIPPLPMAFTKICYFLHHIIIILPVQIYVNLIFSHNSECN